MKDFDDIPFEELAHLKPVVVSSAGEGLVPPPDSSIAPLA